MADRARGRRFKGGGIAAASVTDGTDWSGFHRLDHEARLRRVAEHAGLTGEESAALEAASALSRKASSTLIENAVGAFPLPLGFAVGFVIDGQDTVVPMAVEESSVVAAACHGAKMAAQGGGFTTSATAPVTLGQIEIRDVIDRQAALAAVERNKEDWMARLDQEMPRMVDRGGGLRDITARTVGEDRVVVHLHVDTRDAMGANLVNTLCESLSEAVTDAVGGRCGLRILSNLATSRMVTAETTLPLDAVGGADVADAMVEANEFALLDPYRAATHNKGILNGIDPVVVATGNDWRAVEAGAHAYAARDGQYRGLTKYRCTDDGLHVSLSLPLSLGTVGGMTRLHPVAAACLKVLGGPDGTGLARIAAAVGLAQNLAALRALAAEGIQAGHMRLHAGNRDLE